MCILNLWKFLWLIYFLSSIGGINGQCDYLGVHNTFSTAFVIPIYYNAYHVFPDLIWCTDQYYYFPPAGNTLDTESVIDITIFWDNSGNDDLDLEFRNENTSLTIESFAFYSRQERIIHPLVPTNAYSLKVSQFSTSEQVGYTLIVQVRSRNFSSECKPDQFWPQINSQKYADLTVGSSYTNLQTCVPHILRPYALPHSTYYRFSLSAITTITIQLSYEGKLGNLWLFLCNASHPDPFVVNCRFSNALAQSSALSSGQQIIILLHPGAYYIRIWADDTLENTFSLNLIENCPPTPNQSVQDATPITLPAGIISSLCGTDQYFSFVVNSPTTLSFSLIFDYRVNDLDLHVCRIAGPNCNNVGSSQEVDSYEKLEVVVTTTPATYVVHVEIWATPTATIPFHLVINSSPFSCPSDQFEPNDAIGSATDLNSLFSQEFTDLFACRSDTNPDWYRFSFNSPNRFDFHITIRSEYRNVLEIQLRDDQDLLIEELDYIVEGEKIVLWNAQNDTVYFLQINANFMDYTNYSLLIEPKTCVKSNPPPEISPGIYRDLTTCFSGEDNSTFEVSLTEGIASVQVKWPSLISSARSTFVNSFTNVQIYDSSLQPVSTPSWLFWDHQFTFLFVGSPGNYFIRVSTLRSAGSNFEMTFTSTNPDNLTLGPPLETIPPPTPSPIPSPTPSPIPSPTSTLPATTMENSQKNDDPILAIALASGSAILFLAVIAGCIYFVWSRRRKQKQEMLDVEIPSNPTTGRKLISTGNSRFSHQSQNTYIADNGWNIKYSDLQILMPPIGKGAFGVVYRAMYHGTMVAVKTYVGEDPFGENDWEREIGNLMNLHHPNIILFIGACMEPPCIVTELAEHGSLYETIHKRPNELDDVKRVLQIILDSSKGMAYLHSLGILHRDLKSQNILLCKHWSAKISDFGISRVADDSTMTSRVGTTRWTAPEVLKTEGTYSQKADVYSFGVVLWEIASKEIPFNEKGVLGFMVEDAVMKGERPKMPATCNSDYQKLIENCWAQEPEQRPDFEVVIEMITGWMESGQIHEIVKERSKNDSKNDKK